MQDSPVIQDLSAMQKHAGEAAQLLKMMANEKRLLILCTLLDNELSVSELNARVDLSQSALSQHLATLRKESLVQTRRQAQTIFYSLKGDKAQQVIALLHSLYCPQE